MPSPSPSPSPSSPPPSASSLQDPTANGFHDHVTHSGYPARPSIWPSMPAGNAKNRQGSSLSPPNRSAEPVTWLGPDQSLHPILDINVPSAGAPSDENAQVPIEIAAGDNPHGLPPQGYTQALNDHVQKVNGYAQNHQVAYLDSTSMSFNGSLLTPTQDSQHPAFGSQPQPQPWNSLVYHGQAASSSPPYFDNMGHMMAIPMFQAYPHNWGHNIATGSPHAFQNQAYPMNLTPWLMQGQNLWTQDPTQMMQSQMTATFAPIPLARQVVQRTPCSWPSCTESFARPSDHQRHIEAVHLGIKYHCFWVGCPNNGGKGYCRAEKLRTHQRQKHGFA